MTYKSSLLVLLSMLLLLVTACGQAPTTEPSAPPAEEPAQVTSEPHQYGGWYCPDNFGFVPVDIAKLDAVPAIADRLPTEAELQDNKSLIKVDIAKYPDARALPMKLPRVARIRSDHKDMSELAVVIQAIVVQEDTVVGYRFVNGGNGSARLREITLLSDEEVAAMGSQPFFYSKSVLKANTAEIWRALCRTDYFAHLGKTFSQQVFFSTPWDPKAEARLELDSPGEKAKGYIGMVFGNYYLHIDYFRDGVHYSEKLLLIENKEDKTTELFFASGPYPKDFGTQQARWAHWVAAVKTACGSE
ncbi:MAG: hypothetical protein KDC00_06175 [Flavobacteriales bacterium]|nr:hypothetical protein [Flavobacteriales bacterium]